MDTLTKHGRSTRLAHMALAATIITQLASSEFMVPPLDGDMPNFAFTVHQYSGIAAFGFALTFWIIVVARRKGTDIGALLPWFSGVRLNALKHDMVLHFQSLKQLKRPNYKALSPLASAIHGLGLLLMTGMAGTGVLFVIAQWYGLGEETDFVSYALKVHELLANLVWAYVIGHAALALIHHFWSKASLTAMWSLRANRGKDDATTR